MWVDSLLRKLTARTVTGLGLLVFLGSLLVLGMRDTNADGWDCKGVIPDIFHSTEHPPDTGEVFDFLDKSRRADCAQEARDQLPVVLLEAAGIAAAAMVVLAAAGRLARPDSASSGGGPALQLLQLEELHDRGSLSDAEFVEAKRLLLGVDVDRPAPP